MIVIVDMGIGNARSVQDALGAAGLHGVCSADPKEIGRARKIILPGAGSFDAAMEFLESRGLVAVLTSCAMEKKIPVLGICLGMQLLGMSSEEGKRSGLRWVDMAVSKLLSSAFSVPHIGWSEVNLRMDHPLMHGVSAASFFSFMHSYVVRPADASLVVATATYGEEFPSVIAKDNILGVQFHPERSHQVGLQVLRNFASL